MDKIEIQVTINQIAIIELQRELDKLKKRQIHNMADVQDVLDDYYELAQKYIDAGNYYKEYYILQGQIQGFLEGVYQCGIISEEDYNLNFDVYDSMLSGLIYEME